MTSLQGLNTDISERGLFISNQSKTCRTALSLLMYAS